KIFSNLKYKLGVINQGENIKNNLHVGFNFRFQRIYKFSIQPVYHNTIQNRCIPRINGTYFIYYPDEALAGRFIYLVRNEQQALNEFCLYRNTSGIHKPQKNLTSIRMV